MSYCAVQNIKWKEREGEREKHRGQMKKTKLQCLRTSSIYIEMRKIILLTYPIRFKWLYSRRTTISVNQIRHAWRECRCTQIVVYSYLLLYYEFEYIVLSHLLWLWVSSYTITQSNRSGVIKNGFFFGNHTISCHTSIRYNWIHGIIRIRKSTIWSRMHLILRYIFTVHWISNVLDLDCIANWSRNLQNIRLLTLEELADKYIQHKTHDLYFVCLRFFCSYFVVLSTFAEFDVYSQAFFSSCVLCVCVYSPLVITVWIWMMSKIEKMFLHAYAKNTKWFNRELQQ